LEWIEETFYKLMDEFELNQQKRMKEETGQKIASGGQASRRIE
jgi:hypothetical protein